MLFGTHINQPMKGSCPLKACEKKGSSNVAEQFYCLYRSGLIMTETKDPLYSSYIVNCVFNAFTSYTAVTLNILTIHAINKTLSLPKPLKTLLLSVAVSDLGVGLLAQPLYITLMGRLLQQNKISGATITAFNFIRGLFVYTSFFGVVALSVDRLLAIHLHLRYQELVTFKRVFAAVISIWAFSLFLSSMTAFLIPVDSVCYCSFGY